MVLPAKAQPHKTDITTVYLNWNLAKSQTIIYTGTIKNEKAPQVEFGWHIQNIEHYSKKLLSLINLFVEKYSLDQILQKKANNASKFS